MIIRKYIFLIIVNLILINCSINSKELKTDADFLKFAYEADIILTSVDIQDSQYIKKYNLKKLDRENITEDKLIEFMKEYYSLEFIKKLWKEYTKFMPELPFGLHHETTFALNSKERYITKKSNNNVIVTSLMPGLYTRDDKYFFRDLVIKKNNNKWEITDIKERYEEPELKIDDYNTYLKEFIKALEKKDNNLLLKLSSRWIFYDVKGYNKSKTDTKTILKNGFDYNLCLEYLKNIKPKISGTSVYYKDKSTEKIVELFFIKENGWLFEGIRQEE